MEKKASDPQERDLYMEVRDYLGSPVVFKTYDDVIHASGLYKT